MEKKAKNYDIEIERRRGPLKDVDAVERAYFVKAFGFLFPVSVLFFLLVTLAAVKIGGLGLLQALLFGLLLGLGGPLIVYGIFYFSVAGGATVLFSRLYGGGATGRPRPPTSWRGQALSVRGSQAEALKAFEEHAARYPNDPGPCLRAAALCIEELDDPEAAVAWYQRARAAQNVTPETDAYVLARLADVYEAIGEEARAMVELRRLLQLHQESPYAKGARKRLAGLKAARAEKQSTEENG